MAPIKELAQFFQIAVGSASEMEYLLELSNDLGYWGPVEYIELSNKIVEIRKMLIAFLKTVRK